MQIITSVGAMQRLAKRWRREGVGVALVPTMGYLHAGHLSLVKLARKLAGASGRIVTSIYVNSTQFGPKEDFARYPRDLGQDKRLCRDAGVDVLFVPSDSEVYPGTNREVFSTVVLEQAVSRHMEGISSPTHFRGVATIVAKLFNIALPDVAVFGEKDFQQASVIQRMVRDLNFPVKIALAPTVREADGLALSSRNKYLSPSERSQAAVLWQALALARRTVRASGKPVSASRLRARMIRLIQSQPAARIEYVEFFHPDTLEPAGQVKPGLRVALAVFVGTTRLIDNAGV